MKFLSKILSGDGKSFAVPANEGLGVLVETISAATTLDASHSGKTLILNAAAGVAISLPAVSSALAGFKCKIIVSAAFATTDFTVVSTTNVIQGGAIVNSTFVPASNENTISFVATAESVGDYIEIECDGTNWYVNGVGASAGSITFTAP